jgi:hypothetical protein
VVWVCCGLLASFEVRAEPDEGALFTPVTHDLPGRIVQVWPISISACSGGEADLLVLHVEGSPPTARRMVTWMPCGGAARPGAAGIVTRTLPPEVVGIDVARIPDREGPQLVSLSSRGLALDALAPHSSDEATTRLHWPLPETLPLPPRPRLLTRIPIIDDWDSTGRPTALVPSLAGAYLLDLQSGRSRSLPLPLYADYETWDPTIPAPAWSWLDQAVHWPALARADDDGDGRLDLFALARWAIWIYRTGPGGLPDTPSRRLDLVPFDAEAERRYQSTGQSAIVRDLDGDGRADLLHTAVTGSLTQGRSSSRIHLGGSAGIDPSAPPDATREMEGGFSSLHPVDLDGDGRPELVELSVELGLFQIVRLLLTRRAETRIRILVLDPESSDGLRVVFEDDLSLQLDFGQGSITGLVPGLGDWNGDGVQDLQVPRGKGRIGFRLGSHQPGEPRLGSVVGEQPMPLRGGLGHGADLDGDGLDELIAFDATDAEAPLLVLHNRGRLPGTPPSLRARP